MNPIQRKLSFAGYFCMATFACSFFLPVAYPLGFPLYGYECFPVAIENGVLPMLLANLFFCIAFGLFQKHCHRASLMCAALALALATWDFGIADLKHLSVGFYAWAGSMLGMTIVAGIATFKRSLLSQNDQQIAGDSDRLNPYRPLDGE